MWLGDSPLFQGVKQTNCAWKPGSFFWTPARTLSVGVSCNSPFSNQPIISNRPKYFFIVEIQYIEPAPRSRRSGSGKLAIRRNFPFLRNFVNYRNLQDLPTYNLQCKSPPLHLITYGDFIVTLRLLVREKNHVTRSPRHTQLPRFGTQRDNLDGQRILLVIQRPRLLFLENFCRLQLVQHLEGARAGVPKFYAAVGVPEIPDRH